MSLITDKIFFAALKANSKIGEVTGGRIYSTAIPVPDDNLDNEPLPYIIVTFDGLSNEDLTKDSSFESSADKVQVGIEVVCKDRESLGELTQAVRKQVLSFFREYEPPTDPMKEDLSPLIPDDYDFTASEISYDPVMPCFYQKLTYVCDTNA